MDYQRPALRGRSQQSILIEMFDAATPFQPKAGLLFSGATISYCTPTSGRVAITPVTQTPTGAWVSGGFCQIDSVNQIGVYRLDLPDAIWNLGDQSQEVTVSVQGVGFEPCHVLIPLTDTKDENVQVGTARVNS